MLITIHRGTNEIGGSCVEIATENTRIIIDFGMPLVEKDGSDFDFKKYKDLSIAELKKKKILPNINGIYQDDKKQIDAFLLSHAHIDHYGFVDFLNKYISFYLSKATHKLINISNLFTAQNIEIDNYHYFENEEKFHIGDIEITPYLMDHSAFDAYAFLIKAGNKSIFYSGDFRGHGRKSKLFQKFLDTQIGKIDCLILEGTTIGRGNQISKSETEIQTEMENIFRQAGKINLVYSSGQNIDRLVSIFKACLHTKKTMIVDVYIATILKTLAKDNKIPYPSKDYNIKVLFTQYTGDKLSRDNNKKLMYQFKHYKISKEEISECPDKYVMLVKPSLRIDLERISNIDGGNIIYSLWEGYMAKPYTKKFIDYLENRNFTVHHIHTGGHADKNTLQSIVDSLAPKIIVPIHTFRKDEYKNYFDVPIKELQDGEEFNL